MSDMNVVVMSGTITDDPMIKEFGDGGLVAKINLESRSQYTTRQGEIRESRQFNKATLWNNTAMNAQQFLKKGARVLIQGALSTDSYEKDGQRVYVKQIKVDKIETLGNTESASQPSKNGWGSASSSSNGRYANNSNQDPIPF